MLAAVIIIIMITKALIEVSAPDTPCALHHRQNVILFETVCGISIIVV
jgi:hypothetical protein